MLKELNKKLNCLDFQIPDIYELPIFFLQTFRLNGNPLGDNGILSILKAVKNSTTLASLDIGRCGVSDEGGEFLQDFLKINTSLVELTLSQNEDVSWEGWSYIASALKLNNTLKTLSINACAISDKELKIICEGIGEGNSGLRCLDIEENTFTDVGCADLLEAVTKCISLVDVTLEPCPNVSTELQESMRLLLEDRLENM